MVEIEQWVAEKFNKLSAEKQQELCEKVGVWDEFLFQAESTSESDMGKVLDITFAAFVDEGVLARKVQEKKNRFEALLRAEKV